MSAGGQAKSALTGSGPGGTYIGNDFRAAYVPNETLIGTGQTVGLLEFDSGYLQSDITAYENLAGLPNVPVTPVLLDGYGGGTGGGNDEVSLDIEMAISMAPGLSNILVYEGSTTDDILDRMATDNLAKQIGASWTYPIDANSEQIFMQFAAQGQSFYNASGDSDAYSGTIPTPADDPNITVVGGTTLTTTGPGGAWSSETVWNWGDGVGGSGGVSTVYPIPVWQQGINMTTNEGSTTMRNLPDVAMTADNVYVIYAGGAGSFGGTSCATPLWAAFTALMNELALTNKEPTVGFINPAIYAIGKGSNYIGYTNLFHDITTGNNESAGSPDKFLAVPGYDLCTGWGTPAGGNLLQAIAVPEPLVILPNAALVFSGPVGGPFGPATQSYSLTNTAAGSLSWTLANNMPSLFNISSNSGKLTFGGPAETVAVNVTSTATTLAAGAYTGTLQFTDATDNFGQTRQLNLAVVTPPVITAQPTNEALLDGMTAVFSVGIGTNALMYYQWRENGANMVDGGQFSGATTSSLTITNVSSQNALSYSVVLSNAAGTLVSSNATLTIVASKPVLVEEPTNLSVLPGAPATFSVAAVGNTPYFYHWMFGGTNLANSATVSGVTNSTLTVSNVSPANVGTYTVLVSNSLGSAIGGAVLSLIPVTAPGVSMSNLYSFDSTHGATPYSPLVQGTDSNFYGTTLEGGTDGDGTVFKLTTNGTLSLLLSFDYTDGALTYAGLFQGKDGYLYGANYVGGAYGDGNLFKISTAGALTLLTTLDGDNGELPVAGVVQGSDGNFYGTTLEGGDYGDGTIFRLTSTGALTSLVSFDDTDGLEPSGVLVQGSDGNFYGTTEGGGEYGWGTVFKMTPGGFFTNLYSFTGGNDGGVPIAGVIQGVDGNFYGVTYEAGTNGYGTIFEITSSGAFTTLYQFTGANDGGNPWGGLFQAADGNLYGTTYDGGAYGFGTVFEIAPTGSLATLAQFDGYAAANPAAALIQGKDGNLYGTATAGGLDDDGVVYKLAISGPLQITGQPADQSVYSGGTAVFTVATFGGAPVYYQWQHDGVNLTNGNGFSGATTATLTITNAAAGAAGFYSVVVSNSVNSLTSDDASLEVIFAPPNITTQPASQTLLTGMMAVFTVTAVGDQPLSYQWLDDGVNLTNGGSITGATTASLTVSNVTFASAGNYSVMVSNAIYSVSSTGAVLTVLPVTTPGAAGSNIYSFPGTIGGVFPYAGLIQAKDGYLYGTTEAGGTEYVGVIFRTTLSGGVSTLYNFTNGPGAGANPYGGLLQDTNGSFYGTTSAGGSNYYGTTFRMLSNAATVTTLYGFEDDTDGAYPYDSLIQGSDGNLYGTAQQGGSNAYGSVFKMTTNGVVTSIYGFTAGNDGAYPYGGLIQGRDGKLYGTALEAGSNGYGTVFSLTTKGVLTTLVAFNYTNGAYPEAGVIQGTDGGLYGTTYYGGSNGYGTVFRVTTNGVLTTLCSFNSTNGSEPIAALVQGTDGNLYGATSSGGIAGWGVAFRVTTNGIFTPLLSFNGFNGADPEGALVQANDGNFYGTTAQGGTGFNPSAGGGNGTIYRLTVPIFISNSITAPSAIACLNYTGAGISNAAIAPAGDPLTFAKVSGPAWLIVATNGSLSGTPTNSNLGANTFVVSLTDSNGITATASLTITVVADPPPSFVLNPFAEPWANLDQGYSATIATNGTDPELSAGDILTFGKISGPAWLSVAPNGTLSGTPEDINAGSNTFVVSVTNLGGASATATLQVYVNSPPEFVPTDFTEPAATVGLPYSGTIAANATDPDLSAGDRLTFYLVSGPAWLAVATNGAISGTPSSENLGVNTFLVLVVDSGGLSAVGTMSITVNSPTPPFFLTNPFSEASVQAGSTYAATMATNASDPNIGAVPSFAKVGGPAWLNVAANGGLSGTPLSTNVGNNSFIVSVTDGTGLSSFAFMSINVTAAAPLVLQITPQGTNLMLSWTGGVAPYQVMVASQLTQSGWQSLGSPTTATNMIVKPSSAGAFYQVHGQ